MTIMTRSAELKSYLLSLARPETKEKLRVSQRTGQIKTKDVIQECHPVDLNNEEVNPPEIIINGRSVHRSVLVLPLFPLDTGMVTHPVLVFTMFQV